MRLVGLDYITTLVGRESFSGKMVFNARGAIFFPVGREHREQRAEGIRYEDDYKGNALAAMLGPKRLEIRFHRDFKDEKVAEILRDLLAMPEMEFMRDWEILYQGRRLSTARDP